MSFVFLSCFHSFCQSFYSEADVTHIPLFNPLDVCTIFLFSSFGFFFLYETLHLFCKNRINLPLLPQVGHSHRFTISSTSIFFLPNISYFSFLLPFVIEYSLLFYSPPHYVVLSFICFCRIPVALCWRRSYSV